jgi:hypothetical protein
MTERDPHIAVRDLDLNIAKLELLPGDILVVKCGHHLSLEAVDRIRAMLAGVIAPGVRMLLLEPDWDVAVIIDPRARYA